MIGLTEKQSARVIGTITELRRTLVTEDARETKNRQKFLRNLRVRKYSCIHLLNNCTYISIYYSVITGAFQHISYTLM